ncbi:hypothetical protein YIM730264_20080 [Thermus hydrothermalis]
MVGPTCPGTLGRFGQKLPPHTPFVEYPGHPLLLHENPEKDREGKGVPEIISAITDGVLVKAEAFRGRLLPKETASLCLDGLFSKVLREGLRVEQEAVYIALGVTPSRERQLQGFWLLPTESVSLWEGTCGSWGRGACGGFCSSSPMAYRG